MNDCRCNRVRSTERPQRPKSTRELVKQRSMGTRSLFWKGRIVGKRVDVCSRFTGARGYGCRLFLLAVIRQRRDANQWWCCEGKTSKYAGRGSEAKQAQCPTLYVTSAKRRPFRHALPRPSPLFKPLQASTILAGRYSRAVRSEVPRLCEAKRPHWQWPIVM